MVQAALLPEIFILSAWQGLSEPRTKETSRNQDFSLERILLESKRACRMSKHAR